mgnify:CR=1 FL=1
MEAALLSNRYARSLPAEAAVAVTPTPVRAPRLLLFNEGLADALALPHEWRSGETAAAYWSGNALPAGAQPLALAYAGHQFGQPVPRLGDGRALVIGQCQHADGTLRDLQLKGTGRTPFSRMGDGRAGVGPVLREYLVSEAMHALGIPTTRALAATASGETIARQFGPEPGAILTRVAASHLRFGTLEYFAHRGDIAGLRRVADAAIAWHAPTRSALTGPARYGAWLEWLIDRTAALIVEWLRVGFIHGVMNTDNMSLAGETLDYGPCAFMDDYAPGRVLSSVDAGGRYAFDQQPRMGHWNLARLAECLLPLLGDSDATAIDRAEALLAGYPERFRAHHEAMLAAKLGLPAENAATTAADAELAERLLDLMAAAGADYTNTFHQLAAAAPDDPAQAGALCARLGDTPACRDWLRDYAMRLAGRGRGAAVPEARRRALMAETNPVYIPRNHQIEAVLSAAAVGDMGPAQALHAVLQAPYAEQPGAEPFARPPAPDERVMATFCGT